MDDRVSKKAKWSITVDIGRRVLFFRMSGSLDKSGAGEFVGEVRCSLAVAGIPLGDHDTLCDISDAAILDKETAAHLERMLPCDAGLSTKRTAIVTASAIAGLQAQRLIGHGQTSRFLTLPEALVWLFPD